MEGKRLVTDPGTTITMTCVVNQTTSPPLFVYWYFNNKVLNYRDVTTDDEHIKRITVHTDTGVPMTTSRLEIRDITSSDSGNYSCRPVPTVGDPVDISLHVLNGELPAAIQRNHQLPLLMGTPLVEVFILLNVLLNSMFYSRLVIE